MRVLSILVIVAGCGPAGTFRPSHDGGHSGGDFGPSVPADLAGSPGVDDFGGGGTTFADHCPGMTTLLTGTVWAPNGIDPVSRAYAYVPAKVNPMPMGPYCDKCDHPVDDIAALAVANPDGTFTLLIDGVDYSPTIKLVVNKGRFRKITTINVHCGSNSPPKDATTLPGSSAAGDIPKMAVGTGNQDHLDQVLGALGITEFTCLEGRKSSTRAASCTTVGNLSDLLTAQGGLSLDSYNMVFIGCAPGAYANYATTGVSTATITQNLQAWTAKGGRLFVTDNSYDYVSQAFPTQLLWQGPQAMPFAVAGANVGVGGAMVTGNVDDADLAAWLKVVGVNTSPMVPIAGFLRNWSVQNGPLPMGTKLIVDGTVPFTDAAGAMTMADEPLTANFKVNQCGKVFYSSYHTLSMVKQTQLSAQEKILEYLIFDAASCTSSM